MFWSPDAMSPDYMATVCSLKTFQMMCQSQVPTFGQKKTLLKQLREMTKRLQGFEEKMVALEALTEAESTLYESTDLDAMAQKIKWLEEEMESVLMGGFVSREELAGVKQAVE